MSQKIIQDIRQKWLMHQRWQRAENALVLQAKAACRSWTEGDKEEATRLFDSFRAGHEVDETLAWMLHPFGQAIDQFLPLKSDIMKKMILSARRLPAYAWVKDIHNFGDKSFVSIIGEAGDLAAYATHSKLWRRMGMAPFSKGGVTRSGKQWKIAGGLNADDWTDFGYSGRRRSVMFIVEGCLFRAGPYREVALARKAVLRDRAIGRGLKVAPSAKIPAKERDQYVSDGEIHQQAMYYMGKRLLRDLWKAWRRADDLMSEETREALPSANDTDAPSGAVSATSGLPKGQLANVDTTHSDAAHAAGEASNFVPSKAIVSLPPDPLHQPSQEAGSAMIDAPKGQSRHADPKPSKAPRGAGRAKVTLPRKRAKVGLPARKSKVAA